MKKYLIYAGLFVIIFLAYWTVSSYIRPFTEAITQGMTHREGGRVTAVIVCVPIFAGYFLIDFIIKKYKDK